MKPSAPVPGPARVLMFVANPVTVWAPASSRTDGFAPSVNDGGSFTSVTVTVMSCASAQRPRRNNLDRDLVLVVSVSRSVGTSKFGAVTNVSVPLDELIEELRESRARCLSRLYVRVVPASGSVAVTVRNGGGVLGDADGRGRPAAVAGDGRRGCSSIRP